MKYLGICQISDEISYGLNLKPYYYGYWSDELMYIPIGPQSTGNYGYAKFDMSGMNETQIKEMIKVLSDMSDDIVRINMPLSSRQLTNLKSIIESNMPKSAIREQPEPFHDITLGVYKSGDDASVKFGSTIICDLNGYRNAEKVINIIASAFYKVIDAIKYQLDSTPKRQY